TGWGFFQLLLNMVSIRKFGVNEAGNLFGHLQAFSNEISFLIKKLEIIPRKETVQPILMMFFQNFSCGFVGKLMIQSFGKYITNQLLLRFRNSGRELIFIQNTIRKKINEMPV